MGPRSSGHDMSWVDDQLRTSSTGSYVATVAIVVIVGALTARNASRIYSFGCNGGWVEQGCPLPCW
jgi:hypothetical protein